MRALIVLLLVGAAVPEAAADEPGRPRVSLGAGAGAPHGLFATASAWLGPRFTIDLGAGGFPVPDYPFVMASAGATLRLRARPHSALFAVHGVAARVYESGNPTFWAGGALLGAGYGYLGRAFELRILVHGGVAAGSGSVAPVPALTVSFARVFR